MGHRRTNFKLGEIDPRLLPGGGNVSWRPPLDVVHRARLRRSSVDAAVRRQAFCRRRILSFDNSFVSFDKIALSLLIS
jgi:hypothetical protein